MCQTECLSPAVSLIPPGSWPALTDQVTVVCLPVVGCWVSGREVTAGGVPPGQDLEYKDGSRVPLIFIETRQTVCTLGPCAASALFSPRSTPTFSSDEQGQFSGVWLSAGSYEHDNLIMCVFRNVPTIYEHHQVSLQEFGLTATCLQTVIKNLTENCPFNQGQEECVPQLICVYAHLVHHFWHLSLVFVKICPSHFPKSKIMS